MPPKQAAADKGMIEYVATKLEDSEKAAKRITNETTQFWISVVQDEQLQKLSTQLHEAKAQLIEMRVSLKKMPLIVKVTKAVELKALQQRATKSREHHHHRTTHLDEF